MTNALLVRNVHVVLDGQAVLHSVDAAFVAGRWISIVGPNGAGKSTLLKVLAGLLAFSGEVSLLGKPLAAWPAKARARKVAWLGQSGGAASSGGDLDANHLTVFEIVMLGRLPHQSWLAAGSKADCDAVEHALKQTQAWDWRDRSLNQLSGGERQRVLLARLLAVDSDFLLMDEPLANLDPPHQADWLRIVRDLTARGKTVISVLHEISIALQSDDMLVMAQGRALHQGDSMDSRTQSALQAVFDHRIKVHLVDGQAVAIHAP